MAITRKFNGKVYSYRGSDVRKAALKESARFHRKHGYSARVVKTGKGRNTLYTLYIRK